MRIPGKIANRFREHLIQPVVKLLCDYAIPDAASQLVLGMAYRHLAASGSKLPSLREVGFKAYSQTDDDGILFYIFSIAGITNKKCVEICAGNGIECNTANLIINHGWSGLLFDGDAQLVRAGTDFYRNNKATYTNPPTFICSWITRETINDLVAKNGFEGEIDLLSLDMDGVDYWIWDALEVITPRVVVVEYQDIIGPERALTVPYSEDFNAYRYPTTDGMPNFSGASLPAFVKLARKKGYRLVGCNRDGFNAFFIRHGVADDLIPEIPASECFHLPKVKWGMKHRWPTVENLPWVEV